MRMNISDVNDLNLTSQLNTEMVVMTTMLAIFGVTGAIGNATTFYIFYSRRSSCTSVLFILALAANDFFTCLVTIPFTIAFELLEFKFPDFPCRLYMFLITSTVPFSAYVMLGIAVDRYFGICHPFMKGVTVTRAKVIIIVTGIVAFTFGVLTSLIYGTIYHTDPGLNKEFIIANSTYRLNVSNPVHAIYYSNDSKLEIRRHISYLEGSLDNKTFNFSAQMTTPSNNDYVCALDTKYLSSEFITAYAKVHSAGFIAVYTIVTILYTMIYVNICTHRSLMTKLKKKENHNHFPIAGEEDATYDHKRRQQRRKGFHRGRSNSPGDDIAERREIDQSLVEITSLENSACFEISREILRNGKHGNLPETKENSTPVSADAVDDDNNDKIEGLSLGKQDKLPKKTVHFPTKSSDFQNNGKLTSESPDKNSAHLLSPSSSPRNNRTFRRGIQRRGSSSRIPPNVVANIKTAFVLFIVTVVFLVSYLPALLMAQKLIPFQLIVFYLHYVNNAANPFIFAFMNKPFRQDLNKIVNAFCRR